MNTLNFTNKQFKFGNKIIQVFKKKLLSQQLVIPNEEQLKIITNDVNKN